MTERVRITVAVMGDLAIVRFNDRKILDSANIQELGNELMDLVEKDKLKQILLNFDGVELWSSEALNKLLLLGRAVKEAGGNLRLCAMKEEIREVFSITKLDKMFDIRGDESDGLKAFGM